MIEVPRGFVEPEAVVQQAEAIGAERIVISTGQQSIFPLVDALEKGGFEVRIRAINDRVVVTATKR